MKHWMGWRGRDCGFYDCQLFGSVELILEEFDEEDCFIVEEDVLRKRGTENICDGIVVVRTARGRIVWCFHRLKRRLKNGSGW